MNVHIFATDNQNHNLYQPSTSTLYPNNQKAYNIPHDYPTQHTHQNRGLSSQHQQPDPLTATSQFFCRTMDDSFNCQSTLPQSSRTLCFVDASTLPDNGLSHQRRAGLGIYVVNLQVHPTNFIYIMVTIQETHNVVFAEAAALALAVVVLNRLGFNHVDFHLDSL
jgi:hypothetical protein